MPNSAARTFRLWVLRRVTMPNWYPAFCQSLMPSPSRT